MENDEYYELPFYINGDLTPEQEEIYDRLQFVPTTELFVEFDKSVKNELIVDSDLYEVTRGIIADRLGLVPHNILGKVLGEEIAELVNRIKDLEEKYVTHRHDFSKMFSETPDT